MSHSRPRALPALALVTTLLSGAPYAHAAEPGDAKETSPSGWGIGIGVGVQSRPYKDIGSETRALPLLSYENRWVRIAGLGADLKLGSAGPLSFALGARYALNGYEADDAPILAGMAEREGGFRIGPAVSWRTDYATLSAEALGDASGKSKGTQFRLMLDHTLASGAFRFTPRLVGIWRDKKYNDYYYGVRVEEVRADRPFYQGTASMDVELGLRTGYALDRQQLLFLDLSATGYGKGVKDSPLVDKTSSGAVRFGYIYRY